MFVSRNSHLFEIVIKPKAGEGNITDLYRALNIRDKAPSLQNCFVDTVALNLHGRHMAITFRSEDLADRKQFDALHANLTEHFRDMKIDFDLRYTNPEITPKIAFEHHMGDFLDELHREHPSSSGWLHGARWQWDDDGILTVVVASDQAVENLRRARVLDLLSSGIEHVAGCNVHLNVKNGNFNKDLVQNKMSEDRKKVKKLVEKVHKVDRQRKQITVLRGEMLSRPNRDIDKLKADSRPVTVEGWVFDVEDAFIRKGKGFLKFAITNRKDSIAVKVVRIAKRDRDEFADAMLKCRYARVRGVVQWDDYVNELTIDASDINDMPEPVRMDNAAEKRIELHAHSRMSALDALGNPSNLVQRAALWGHKAIAITDHGVVQAFPEFYSSGKKFGIKTILGMEGYLADEEKPDKNARLHHVTLLVTSKTGLANLYKLVTKSHIEHFYRRPRLLRSVLAENREGLLVGSACENGEVYRAVCGDVPVEDLEEIVNFYDYLEIMPRANNDFMIRSGQFSEEDLENFNRVIVSLGKKTGKPVVATGDAHFLDPHDAQFRSILQFGQGYKDADIQAPLYLRTTDEMLEEFSYLGKKKAMEVVIEAPAHIAAQCDDVAPIPDGFFPPEMPDAEEEIKALARSKARHLYGDPLPEIVAGRLDRELAAICGNGYAVLYLIAQKLCAKSLKDGYVVGSRGSVGSSLVACMCGITEVNPLPPHYYCIECKNSEFMDSGTGIDLPDKKCPRCGNPYKKDGFLIPFEVFMGFKGNKAPDIDLNFSGDYQNIVHRYVGELFGEKHVIRAGTIATIASRTAYGFVIKHMEEHSVKSRKAEINRLVNGCTGVKRTTGQHPGGILIVPKGRDINEFTPINYPANDRKSNVLTTHFDYHSIENRLVKLDILGHDNPTSIRRLKRYTGVDPMDIPLDDPKTMALFTGSESIGLDGTHIDLGTLAIPEFGTEFVRGMLRDTRPASMEDLVRISGLSHGTNVWLNNAQELVKKRITNLQGVISVRDDIMNNLISMGMEPLESFEIMERVRKGKNLTEVQEKSMRDHGAKDWYINSCNRISYMFPKAHAVAYVLMAFRIAYFKVHYPLEFYADYLSLHVQHADAGFLAGKKPQELRVRIEELNANPKATARDKGEAGVMEVVEEMFMRGFKFGHVSLERSNAYEFIPDSRKKMLIPPFASLSGVGSNAAKSIVEVCRKNNGRFRSREQLQTEAKINKKVMESLVLHGCFGDLPETDQGTLF